MKPAIRCEGVWRFCDAYVDGEFGDAERAEFDAHLEMCESCQATVREQAAWKVAVRAAAPREKAPDLLRARLKAALAEESKAIAAERLHDELGQAATLAVPPPRSLAARAWPYAAAALVACTLLFSQGRHAAVTADLIAKHQRNLPIEVSGRSSDDLRRWYADKVDFPVRPPTFVTTQTVALRGGRLANVRDHQAAYLVYDIGGEKVSVFIFDPSEMNLEARRHALVGNREVYLDDSRGYNVAIYRDNGVGYAIASDLDQDQMLRLVSSAVSH